MVAYGLYYLIVILMVMMRWLYVISSCSNSGIYKGWEWGDYRSVYSLEGREIRTFPPLFYIPFLCPFGPWFPISFLESLHKRDLS